MIAKIGRFPALQTALLVLTLLMALIPSSTAFADLTATEDAAPVEETATEAVATEPAEEPAADPQPEPEPAEELGAIAESAPAGNEEAAAVEAAEPVAGATADGSGANAKGPYDPSGAGEPSGNGNGGDNGNKPCAGCVGNADDKNPPGQLPGPDDDGNKGYECDGNSGVGKTNPAHSGCQQNVQDPDPSIGLVKTGPKTSKVGRTITYNFSVKNTGDTALSDVHITDPLIGGGAIAVTPSTLPVGGTGQASAQYTVRTQDVNASNEVPNTATVKGTDPDGDVVTAQDSWVVKVPPVVIVVPQKHTICHATGKPDKYVVISPSVRALFRKGHIGTHHHGGRDIIPPFEYDANRNGVIDADETFDQRWDAEGQAIFDAGCQAANAPAPEIELVKGGPGEAAVGEVITYTFDVENTGDTKLTNVHVTDPLLGGTQIAVTPPMLEPGEFGEATAEYTVDQADIVNETVPNEATAHGTPPTGPEVLDTDDHVVKVPDVIETPEPEIELIKDGPDEAGIGETITYTFDVTNSGETALTNVHVTDPLLGGEPIAVTPSTLLPDQTGEASAEYTVRMEDLLHDDPMPGSGDPAEYFVPNTATAHGTPPQGPDVTAKDSHEVKVPLIPGSDDPSINLEKDGPATARVGDRIIYTFTVTNTGDVTLTNVRVRDPLVSTRMLTVTPSTLAPDAVGTASATYRVTEADGEAGEILNTAIGRGTPPTGPDVVDRDDHVVEVPPDTPEGPEPGIELEKTGPATARVGDTITYRFRATNTGNTVLTNVHITDTRLGLDNLAVTPSTLRPGQSGTASATYTVRPRDGAAGSIHNTAIVTGTPPTGPPITDRDDHTTDVPGRPPGPPPERPDLPATGTDAPTQLLLGMLALMMGGGLLLMARRTATPQFEAWTTGTMPARRLSGSDSPQPVHRRFGGGAVGPAT